MSACGWMSPWEGRPSESRSRTVRLEFGILARVHSLRRSRQSHARGEFGMACRVEAQEDEWRSCSGVQISQTRLPVFRMLAQPDQDRQRRLPSGVTQAWRGRHHRNREKGVPQAGRNGVPLAALHPRARQPTRHGLYERQRELDGTHTGVHQHSVTHPAERHRPADRHRP